MSSGGRLGPISVLPEDLLSWPRQEYQDIGLGTASCRPVGLHILNSYVSDVL